MIVVVYARKSTDDSDRNAEARSTQRQIDSATAYAKTKGWTVDPHYIFVDENTSGAEWKAPVRPQCPPRRAPGQRSPTTSDHTDR